MGFPAAVLTRSDREDFMALPLSSPKGGGFSG